jgi:hypothetical protein
MPEYNGKRGDQTQVNLNSTMSSIVDYQRLNRFLFSLRMNFCDGVAYYSNNDIRITRDEYFNLKKQSRIHKQDRMAKKVKKAVKMPMKKMKGKAC